MHGHVVVQPGSTTGSNNNVTGCRKPGHQHQPGGSHIVPGAKRSQHPIKHAWPGVQGTRTHIPGVRVLCPTVCSPCGTTQPALTVGIACVLTQMPPPSGRLGSAQRRTASRSDSGSTSGSLSSDTTPAAAEAAVLPTPLLPACWLLLDRTPGMRAARSRAGRTWERLSAVQDVVQTIAYEVQPTS